MKDSCIIIGYIGAFSKELYITGFEKVFAIILSE